MNGPEIAVFGAFVALIAIPSYLAFTEPARQEKSDRTEMVLMDAERFEVRLVKEYGLESSRQMFPRPSNGKTRVTHEQREHLRMLVKIDDPEERSEALLELMIEQWEVDLKKRLASQDRTEKAFNEFHTQIDEMRL